MDKNNLNSESNNEKGFSTNEKTINYLKNIKSLYICKKILANLHEDKALNIIRYNKHFQKKLNINIDDFLKCSVVIIELIPFKNKYGQFINIANKEQRCFYHIYFNDSQDEIRRTYITKGNVVNKIKILINFQVTSFYQLFSYCECIESINFISFQRKNITNMSFMFYKCSSLKEINFSNFITDNVDDMRCMFYECSSLKELNLSKFNTENVKNMSYMFSGCSSLKKLNVDNFDTELVTNMTEMFSGCSSLIQLDISNFIIENECIIDYMFKNCSEELKEKASLQNKFVKIRYNYENVFLFEYI